MYPKNIAFAVLTLAEVAVLAARHMQMAPHPSFVPRRTVMHQPQAAITALPHGYMHTAPASDPAAAQAEQLVPAAKAVHDAQSRLAGNTVQAIQVAQVAVETAKLVVRQVAKKAAERAARQTAVETAEREARQAAAEMAEREARQAAAETAEREARQAAAEAAEREVRQAAVEAAEREARQAAADAAKREARQAVVAAAQRVVRQAANKAAERAARYAALKEAGQAARQAAVEAAEQAAHQAAVEAAQIAEATARVMGSEPSVQVAETVQEQIVETIAQAVPQEMAKQATQALQAELPPVIAQTAVKTLEEKTALAQKSHIPKQNPAPVAAAVSAPQTAPVAAAVPASQTAPVTAAAPAPRTAPVTASAPQTAPATAAPAAVPPAAVLAVGAFGVPSTLHFCTVAGSSYLFKVTTLYRSLEAHSSDFMLYVCCIDDETQAALEKLHLPRCIAVSVDALGDSGLAELRSQRSTSEFCWTLKSHFLLWLLNEKGLHEAVYLDSDIAFFSDPKRLYDDWGNASVYLCRQRDLDWVEQKYGKYQAGVIGFKNDEQGVAAVRWWRDKCRAWCFAAPDTGQYGDQKYLDDIPALFRSVRVSTHRGIDAAPWNTVYNNNYPISVSGSEIRIDGDPLVAYHFACLDVIDEQHFDLWNLSGISIGQTISNAIYVPYLAQLRKSITEVHAKTGGRYYSRKTFGDARTPYIYSDKNLSISHWDGMFGFCTIASKQYASRTLALYSSLEKHAGNFHIWVCCMDDMAYGILSSFNLEKATLVKVSDVETAEVRATRTSKKLYEYCWTMKPLLCQYVFQNYNISRLLYCDADMYFFASPQAIHNEWRRYETYLNLQRGSAQLEAVHGMYQAGLIGFSKAAESLRTLNWWAQQCTAWCYDNHDDHSRWGDQKYLTQMPNLFTSIKVNNRYGLLAAPWNIVMNNSKDLPVHTDAGGTVWIGDEALTCFHFGSINVLSDSAFDLWKHEPLNFDPAIIESIYKPYLAHLRGIYGEIRAKGFDTAGLFESGSGAQNPFSL